MYYPKVFYIYAAIEHMSGPDISNVRLRKSYIGTSHSLEREGAEVKDARLGIAQVGTQVGGILA